jgi:CDP-diacylglycerol---serine O-phosphatidyltransferase
MRMPRVSILASLCTLGNALCGFGAITLMAKGLEHHATDYPSYADDVMVAGYLIFLAMVFDALDGRLARFARATSDFGGQLDSLADAISFGLAPAFLMNRLVVERLNDTVPPASDKILWIAWVCGAVYLGCTLIRLARFNVENVHDEEAHRSFKGLPSPAAAGALVSLIIVIAGHCDPVPGPCATVLLWLAPAAAVFLGLMMVSDVRYVHLLNQFIRGRRTVGHLVMILFMIAILVLLGVVLREIILPIGFGVYVLSGPLLGVWRHLFGRRAAAGPPDLFNPPPSDAAR